MEKSWLPAYRWMVEKMRCHIGSSPTPDCMPIWAWHQWEGSKRKKPDLRAGRHLDKGQRGVRIEFEPADADALLSDFSLWHFALNYWYLPGSEGDGKAFEEELASHGLCFFDQKPLPHAGYHARIVASWDRMFDLDWSEPDVSQPRETKAIQATVWELRRDQVRCHHHFSSR